MGTWSITARQHPPRRSASAAGRAQRRQRRPAPGRDPADTEPTDPTLPEFQKRAAGRRRATRASDSITAQAAIGHNSISHLCWAVMDQGRDFI